MKRLALILIVLAIALAGCVSEVKKTEKTQTTPVETPKPKEEITKTIEESIKEVGSIEELINETENIENELSILDNISFEI